MTPLLDCPPPYPFERADAQELLVKLMRLYPSKQQAESIAEDIALNMSMINTDQGFFFVWREILKKAMLSGKLRLLVQTVYDRLEQTSPFRNFFIELLNNTPVTLTESPLKIDGAPKFIAKSDDVLQPEALLYHDDLMVQIGQVPRLIGTLQRLFELAPAVCRLSVATPSGSQLGTGFRIGANRLLTNWHVVHSRAGATATAISAEFGYEDNAEGGVLAPVIIACVIPPVAFSQENDWAIVELHNTLPDTIPVIDLSQAVTPSLEEAAYIIQHPNGDRKRLAYVRNQISFFDERVVQYLTDTQGGSSGSPVFNADGQLIGLHHAGGRPQTVAGKAPLSKNEGIRISQIVKDIAAINQ